MQYFGVLIQVVAVGCLTSLSGYCDSFFMWYSVAQDWRTRFVYWCPFGCRGVFEKVPVLIFGVMDKARRQELKNLKYKKRLRRIGALNADTIKSPKGPNYNYTSFKNHSAPCSCMFCSGQKYSRKALPDFTKEHNDEIYPTAQYFGEFAIHYGACLIR